MFVVGSGLKREMWGSRSIRNEGFYIVLDHLGRHVIATLRPGVLTIELAEQLTCGGHLTLALFSEHGNDEAKLLATFRGSPPCPISL